MDDEIIIYINGKFIEKEKAFIPITSEAFLFGVAIFETLRTYKGKLFRLREHLERLKYSAVLSEFELALTLEQIEKDLKHFVNNLPWEESRLRMIATRSELIFMAQKLQEKPAWMYSNGVKLLRYEGQRSLPEAKNLANILCYLAHQHAFKNGAYDSILVDGQGYVRECAYANIFWVRDDQLFTNDEHVLRGITRQTVIELVDHCQFQEILYEDLIHADEVFITQTSSGILPVSNIEGMKIGDGLPGKLTKELMDRFAAKVWQLD